MEEQRNFGRGRPLIMVLMRASVTVVPGLVQASGKEGTAHEALSWEGPLPEPLIVPPKVWWLAKATDEAYEDYHRQALAQAGMLGVDLGGRQLGVRPKRDKNEQSPCNVCNVPQLLDAQGLSRTEAGFSKVAFAARYNQRN